MSTRSISLQEYEAFRRFLEQATGIVLGENKHYLVTSRLSKLMKNFGIASFSDLLKGLNADRKLREYVIDAMTTNETSWFRDMHPFNALTTEILPDLAKRKQTNIRIWSAACSTGQEPYSISISIQEYLKKNPGALNKRVEIIATDLSPSVLEQAKAGCYEEIATSRGLSAERRDRFFIRKEDHWEVRPEISERIAFKAVNLMQNFSGFGKFDVIFCRNVLIYFSTELKKDVLARMAAALNPDGYLILGGSESMANYSDAFHMIRTSNTVVYKLKPR